MPCHPATPGPPGVGTTPYATPSSRATTAELDHLRRGVQARVAYECTALERPGKLDALRCLRQAGHQVRVLDELPTKMMVADRRHAIVPLGHDGTGLDGIVLISSPPLVDALVQLFESLWRVAVPVPLGLPDSVAADEVDVDLLTLLATGLKDEAIAHQLGVSLSTVQHRLRRTMDQLGSRSRVQMILQAAREGLLPDVLRRR